MVDLNKNRYDNSIRPLFQCSRTYTTLALLAFVLINEYYTIPICDKKLIANNKFCLTEVKPAIDLIISERRNKWYFDDHNRLQEVRGSIPTGGSREYNEASDSDRDILLRLRFGHRRQVSRKNTGNLAVTGVL